GGQLCPVADEAGPVEEDPVETLRGPGAAPHHDHEAVGGVAHVGDGRDALGGHPGGHGRSGDQTAPSARAVDEGELLDVGANDPRVEERDYDPVTVGAEGGFTVSARIRCTAHLAPWTGPVWILKCGRWIWRIGDVGVSGG